MPKLLCLAGIICLLLIGNALGQNPAATPLQPAFSDSVIYQPRQFPDSKSKKKDNAPVSPSSAGTVDQVPITIPVSVFDASAKFVADLQRPNFRVFIDGKKVEISSVETRKEPLNLILLVDASPSTQYSVQNMEQVVASIIEQLDTKDKVSIIKFAGKPTVLVDLTEDREKVRLAINATKKIKFDEDGTSIYDTLRFVFEKQITADMGRTVLILLTDGVDTTSRKANFATSLEWAEKGDATIFPVYFDTLAQRPKDQGAALRWMNRGLSGAIASGVLDDAQTRSKRVADEYEIGKMYLNDLVFLSGGHAIPAGSFQDSPKETASALLDSVRLQYFITFSPGQPAVPGQRKQIMVRVDRPNLAVLARGSYIVKPQEK